MIALCTRAVVDVHQTGARSKLNCTLADKIGKPAVRYANRHGNEHDRVDNCKGSPVPLRARRMLVWRPYGRAVEWLRAVVSEAIRQEQPNRERCQVRGHNAPQRLDQKSSGTYLNGKSTAL
jgi:hypothetical protein